MLSIGGHHAVEQLPRIESCIITRGPHICGQTRLMWNSDIRTIAKHAGLRVCSLWDPGFKDLYWWKKKWSLHELLPMAIITA